MGGEKVEWMRGESEEGGKKRDKYRCKRPKRGERKRNMEGIDKKRTRRKQMMGLAGEERESG